MIATRHLVFILLGIVVLFQGCIVEINGDSDTLRGQGPLAQQFRAVSGFSEVILAIEGDLFIEQGPDIEFRVEAQQNLLNHINTFVRGGILYIESEPNLNLRPTEPIRFVLTAPVLDGVSIAGSGDVIIEDWQATDIALSIAGSGDMIINNLTTEVIDVSIAASGDVELSGESIIQNVSIVGSGDYNARTFLTNVSDVSIAGSGDAFISVAEELNASIVGSGSVYYSGEPSITSSVLGSGQVRRLD